MAKTYGVVQLFLSVLITLAFASEVTAKLTVVNIFTDNAVMQRDRVLPVWGWAEPGQQVSVSFGGQTKRAETDERGRWHVTLDAMPASTEPRVMTIESAARPGEPKGETLTFNNLVVGEVWFCAGQSNMGLSLAEVFNAKEEVAAANFPRFRFVAVRAVGAAVPQKDIAPAKWQVCTPETAAGFAGTAYFFGRALHKKLNVPVGIIETDVGATGIEGWVPLDGYRRSLAPELQKVYRETAAWDPASEIGKPAHEAAFKQIREWVPAAKAAVAEGKSPPPEPLVPAPPTHIAGPTIIFNGAIAPLVLYPIRGVVWYQGESNPGEGKIYEHKLRALISSWRSAWGRATPGSELPIYVVQLTNEGKGVEEPAEEENFRYVPVRQAQRRATDLPNTGLVVAIDLGEEASGHPRNKRGVGERAALWAFAKDYKIDVPYTGPRYKGVRFDGNRAIVSFDHVGSGLMIADKDGLDPVREIKNGVLKHFSVRGDDGKWHWAEAKIEGETVVVTCAAVARPTALRYADSMNPKGGKLYNREGLPASPFRTDGW